MDCEARNAFSKPRTISSRGSESAGASQSPGEKTRSSAENTTGTPRDLARFGELFWGSRLIDRDGSLLLNGAAQPNGSLC